MAILVTLGAGMALDATACSPAAVGGDGGVVCEPDTGTGCSCDPNTYKTADCYTGPAGTNGKGVCKLGKRSCNNGVISDCVGEVVPQTETCNLADDDCDGFIDNVAELDAAPIARCNSPACDPNFTDAAIYCFGPDPGICGAGVKTCAPGPAGGTPNGCIEFIKQGVPEVCNNIDDDCNGSIDDGLDNEGPCDLPDGSSWGDASPFVPDAALDAGGGPAYITGECLHGNGVCQAGKDVCFPSQPIGEIDNVGFSDYCDGKDNNCNGVIDDKACAGQYVSATDAYCCEYMNFNTDWECVTKAQAESGTYTNCHFAR